MNLILKGADLELCGANGEINILLVSKIVHVRIDLPISEITYNVYESVNSYIEKIKKVNEIGFSRGFMDSYTCYLDKLTFPCVRDYRIIVKNTDLFVSFDIEFNN